MYSYDEISRWCGGTKQVQRNLLHSLFQLLIIAVGAEEQKICTKGALLLRPYSDDGDLGNERLKLLKKGCVCVCVITYLP